MCGIVGYTGRQNALPVLLEGLKKLEYRGYDSAGIALQEPEGLRVYKSKGAINALENMVSGNSVPTFAGIGHTRWATHGRPSDENAHPHISCCEKIAVVHNGIIENYQHIKAWLKKDGHVFRSETDTEILAHLIEHFYEDSLFEAVCRAITHVEGSYALVAVYKGEKDRLICARKDSPLVVGLGENENFVASDIPALLAHTRKVYILEDGETAVVTPSTVDVYDREKKKLSKKVYNVDWDAVLAERGGYPHFMLKEIMEQPHAVRETLRSRINPVSGEIVLPELKMSGKEICNYSKIHIVACGTAYHAGLVGKYLFETLTQTNTEVDLASEFRYRDPLVQKNDLVIVISQSGETADTLAALRLAHNKGARVLAITNVVGSSVSREADDVLFTWAGPEIAVASTKAYITQLIALYLLAFHFAKEKNTLNAGKISELVKYLSGLPEKIAYLLEDDKLERYREYAGMLTRWQHAFFIGRNLDYAVAMEGSLKLKEISYIHAEAYPAGELKHGTLALITKGIPVIALATQNSILEKSLSNIQEVKARDGHILIIAPESVKDVSGHADEVIFLPDTDNLLAPVLSIVPMQLISYYAADYRGCPIDKPRNLAKSVTVE